MHLIQNFLLWIDRFLLHSQINNCYFYCNVDLNTKLLSLFTKINRVVTFCSHYSIIQSICWVLPRIKISFFLLTAWEEQLLSISNIIAFLPHPSLFGNENFLYTSNLAPFSEYVCLLGSTFLVHLAAPSKEFPNAKSSPTWYGHKSNI